MYVELSVAIAENWFQHPIKVINLGGNLTFLDEMILINKKNINNK